MSELQQHFKKGGYSEQFEPGEYNNALRFTYTALWCAVADGADTLIIGHNGFVWRKDGVQVGKYLGGDLPTPDPTYSANFRKILERDSTVRAKTAIFSECPEKMVVHLDLT